MAITYVNLSGFKRGINSDEAGINIAKFDIEVEPEINDWLPGKDGQARGKAVGDPQRKVSLEGEIFDITAAGSVFVAGFATALVPTNSVNYFGATAGGLYIDRGTVGNAREGWKHVSAEATSKFNVA